MKLKEFLAQVDFCTKGMTEEKKGEMDIVLEVENTAIPVTYVESTPETLYVISKSDKRATA